MSEVYCKVSFVTDVGQDVFIYGMVIFHAVREAVLDFGLTLAR